MGERAELLVERYAVHVITTAEAAAGAETLILAVKPQDMAALLEEMVPHVPAHRLVVSVAARRCSRGSRRSAAGPDRWSAPGQCGNRPDPKGDRRV